MFNLKDRNKLQRYLAKKPTEAVVVAPEKTVAEPAYQQQQQRRPKNHRQQLEQKATSAAAPATVVVDKSDEPRKLKQKKKKGKKMIAGNDGDEQQQQISAAEEEEVRSTKVDSDGSGENLSSKKNMKKKNKKKKKAKEGKSGQAAVAVDDDDADDKSEPTKQNSKKRQKVAGNNTNHQHNKLQQALSLDVASMIAAFHDKGFVEEDDEDEDEEGDFDVEDDLEDEVYEEKEEEDEKVEEPRAKKAKKEEEKEAAVITTTTKKNLNQKNLNNKTASAESAKDNSEAVRRSAELGAKAKQTLATSMFRSLNELLYTSDSKESRRKFTAAQFRLYHQAYEGLAAQWPLQPVDYLIEVLKKRLQKRKKNEGNYVIADVGCGSRARIAEALLPDFSNIEVYSYDLYSSSEADSSVISADMARLPLDSATVDAAVYSLSLMPTNLKDIVREANRILKPGGQLLVVEVASRFADYQSGSADRRGSLNIHHKKGAGDNGKEKVVNLDLQRFAADLKPYGFSLTASEPLPPNGFFTYLAFKKTGDAERLTPKSRLPEIVLKACLYKAR